MKYLGAAYQWVNPMFICGIMCFLRGSWLPISLEVRTRFYYSNRKLDVLKQACEPTPQLQGNE